MVGSSAPTWGRRVGLAVVLLLPINGFIQHIQMCPNREPWHTKNERMMRLLAAQDEGSSIAASTGAFTPVDSSDPRETRPKLPDMSDEDMAEIDQKFAKRKAARRDRIAKRYGEREAQIDEASDVVPTRDTPFWYAVKVKMGMELILRDTFSQLASLPAYRGRIFDVLVPEVKSVRSLGKQLRLIQKPQYPGYVFIQMQMSRELYDVILSPNGVASFVGRRVYGKGVIPNPMRNKEVQRLQERAVYEAGRTIDLEAIPFRPQDKVEVLSGEFAFARGRVTSVKETTVAVVVKKGQVEVRKELPFADVRKLSQEDLDAELKEWGGEALRAYNKARPGEALETGDMWKRISESNAAATRGLGPSSTAGAAPQKRAPQKKGPSLYRILSDFVNLENFDPDKPPDVESMVAGMLELTGAKEDTDGFYTAKADKAVKAWKIWKDYQEEKEERRRRGRDKALRRKTMGYDQFDDSWKSKTAFDSLDNEEGERRGERRRGTRDGFVESADQWDFAKPAVRDAKQDGLEMEFLERLMEDLDGPTATATGGASEKKPRPVFGGEDADMVALRGMKRMSSLDEGMGGMGGAKSFGGERERRPREGSSPATLTGEEQEEFDRWMTKLTSPDKDLPPVKADWRNPGMGAKPRATHSRQGTLDPAEEAELNDWLSKFDQQYSEDSGGRMVKKGLGNGRGAQGLGAAPVPSLFGEGEGPIDDELEALFGGSGRDKNNKAKGLSYLDEERVPVKSVSEARADVDRELDAVLAKLDAMEKDKGQGKEKDKGQGKEKDQGLGYDLPPLGKSQGLGKGVGYDLPPLSPISPISPIKPEAANKRPRAAAASLLGDDIQILPMFEEEADATGTGRGWRKGGREEEEDEEDDRLPVAFNTGRVRKEPGLVEPVRRRLSLSGRASSGGPLLESEESEDDVAANLLIHNQLWGTGQENDDAYMDPEETPGQFIEEGLEDALDMGRPKDVKAAGFMFDDPTGAGAAAGPGVGMGGRGPLPGMRGKGLGDSLFGGAWDDDDVDDPELAADLADLEKLDKIFAEEAKRMGAGGKGKGKGKGGMGEDDDDIDWAAIMGAAGDDDDDDPLGVGMDLGKELKGLDLGKLAKGKAGAGAGAGGGRKPAAPPAPKAGAAKAGAAAAKQGALKQMKVAELKAECKRLGLPVSGTKGELLDRLKGAGLA